MSYSAALLALGIPAILGLALLAARRIRALKTRITQVQDEIARSPQSPYAAMAELYNPPPPPSPPQERTRGKIHD